MPAAWGDSRRAFADATAWFVRTTTLVGDRWGRPGLGEWDVRALVGHTSRSLLTVEAYLERPAGSVGIRSAADYVRATRAIAAGPEVAARGRQAGVALGPDPAAAVAQICTCADHDTIVRSRPSRSTFASPNGTRCSPSGTSLLTER